MEKHKCKLCPRSFTNGRALGGHMRSHITSPPLPPKPPIHHHHHLPSSNSTSSSPSSSSSSYSTEPKKKPPQVYTLRENPRKSFKFTDPTTSTTTNGVTTTTASSCGGLLLLPDRESETESSKTHKTRPDSSPYSSSSPEIEPAVSSISDHCSEEDVAICLMMLSRGNWTKRPARPQLPEFRCDLCDRVFPSHQALGGHRSGHRKTKNCTTTNHHLYHHHHHTPGGVNSLPTTTPVFNRCHRCPFCGKVFASGQALGGHKRSHLLLSSSSSSFPHNPARLIDLNLPAPPEGDEVSEVLGGEILRIRS